MNAVFSPGWAGRAVFLAFLLPILLLPAGCDLSATYPADLVYPPRADALVVAPPKRDELYPIPPGKLDEWVNKVEGLEGGKALYPKNVKENERRELNKALVESFGKPASPIVTSKGDDAETVKEQCDKLNLDPQSLQEGSKLYRRHCLQCHGLAGDGRGPTGPWVSPPPRDYRQGIFKFISTSVAKPSRADLQRTLHNGLEGTSMPSFALLKDDEIQHLISYVIHLSIRGQAEYETLKTVLEGGSLANDSIAGQVDASLTKIAKLWYEASYGVRDNSGKDIQLRPSNEPAYRENEELRLQAVQRGYDLFIDPKGKAICLSCHLDFGRQSVYKYEDWGSLTRPMNLTTGVYRGGRRPIDHYWRIRGGAGPVMPANTSLTDDEIWDVVAFIQALPYPAMLPTRPQNLRARIYGTLPVPRLPAVNPMAK